MHLLPSLEAQCHDALGVKYILEISLGIPMSLPAGIVISEG